MNRNAITSPASAPAALFQTVYEPQWFQIAAFRSGVQFMRETGGHRVDTMILYYVRVMCYIESCCVGSVG